MKKLENQKEKTMQEICKRYGEAIPGYPNYRITRDAKVYSNRSGNWVRVALVKKLSNVTSTGVKIYRPYVNVYNRLKSLYRLLAITYIPKPEGKNYVCHKDNNPMNLSLDNLYWGTQKENIHQAMEDGIFPKKGVKHPNSKLTREEVKFIRESGLQRKELAKRFGVSKRTIYRVLSYTHYGEV